MTRDKLNDEYFEWLRGFVPNKKYSKGCFYRKMLSHLHDTEFTYSIGTDGNRAEDGIDLRYRFGCENSYDGAMVTAYLDDRPCSVLEMMVALAVRCEEHIMGDADIGDRTGRWFWDMVKNLGLSSETDLNFNQSRVDAAILRLLNREYGRNGEGGLFTVENSGHDLRSVEIWYQLCWYLNTKGGV
jgi:hypothetical protein